MLTKYPIVATFVATKPELITCRPGRIVGREDMRPANFMNATKDPVNVMPPVHTGSAKVVWIPERVNLPIKTPRYPVTICRVERSDTWAMIEPMLVRTAAKPTTE
jgi:hypothetical protein